MLHVIRVATQPAWASIHPGAGVDLDRITTRVSAEPGTYVLVLRAARTLRLQIGRLGRLHLLPGNYAYVGSAFGPGGLRARLAHHGQVSSNPHWHIDYLRAQAEMAEIWYSASPVRQEHAWALICQGTPGVSIAAARLTA